MLLVADVLQHLVQGRLLRLRVLDLAIEFGEPIVEAFIGTEASGLLLSLPFQRLGPELAQLIDAHPIQHLVQLRLPWHGVICLAVEFGGRIVEVLVDAEVFFCIRASIVEALIGDEICVDIRAGIVEVSVHIIEVVCFPNVLGQVLPAIVE